MPTRTISNAGGNWNAVGTWVEGAVPVLGDNVVATGTSGQLTVNVGSVCTSIDFTNYTNTLTVNQTLNVAGAVTLVPGMTITTTAGTPVLVVSATGTLTSNGKAWPYAMQFTGSGQTFTLADDWTVNGTLTVGNGTTQTINGNNFFATTNLTINSSGAVTGTTVFNMTGSGTWSRASTCILRSNLVFNTAGAIVITNVSFDSATITRTAGTITHTGTLTIGGGTGGTTLDTNGIDWNNITLTGTSTITLTSNLSVAGSLTPSGSASATVNGNSIILTGTFNPSGGSTLTGTTNLMFNAAGSNTWVGGTSGVLRLNTDINCGTLVLSGVCIYGTGTLLHTSGVVDSSAGTLQVQNSPTLNLNGITITNFILGGSSLTTTLASDLVISQSIVSTTPTSASRSGFVSSSPGTQRVLTLLKGATCNLGFINATDIDSSQGRTIYTRKGTLSNATNWKLLNEPKTVTA